MPKDFSTGMKGRMRTRIVILQALMLSSCSLIGQRAEPIVPSSPSCELSNSLKEPVQFSYSKLKTPEPKKSIKSASLPKPDLKLTPEVSKELAKLLKDNRAFIPQSLVRRQEHYEQIREVFASNGIPEELINVAMIESSFKTEAGSHKGALGMWQFMKSTAKNYGLKVSGKHDERKDPILSTQAAALHLKDLYHAFGDWFLALAAYNAGPGAISRLVTKHGKADFWELVRSGKLTQETARFVPKFIAVSLIVNDLNHYGFNEVAHLQDEKPLNIG